LEIVRIQYLEIKIDYIKTVSTVNKLNITKQSRAELNVTELSTTSIIVLTSTFKF